MKKIRIAPGGSKLALAQASPTSFQLPLPVSALSYVKFWIQRQLN